MGYISTLDQLATHMRTRNSTPLEIDQATYQQTGHQLIDQISAFYAGIHERPVTPKKSAKELRGLMGSGNFPSEGASAEQLMAKATELMMENSLLMGVRQPLGNSDHHTDYFHRIDRRAVTCLMQRFPR